MPLEDCSVEECSVEESYLGHKLLNPEGGTICSESVNTPPGPSVINSCNTSCAVFV